MNIKHLAISLAILSTPALAHAWDITELLNKAGQAVSSVNGSDISDAMGGIVNGLFTKSDLEVKDLAGTWTVNSSAVSFQSDNFLQQAGGSAAATLVENKLNPYYRKYGLTGSTLTIAEDGSFTLQMKKLKLTGTITKQEAKKGKPTQGGNFYFNFNKFGVSSLGNVNTYVTKSPDGLDVMFDASKLQAIMNSIASFSKMKMARTATDLLNSYDGICIGFHLDKQTLPAAPRK